MSKTSKAKTTKSKSSSSPTPCKTCGKIHTERYQLNDETLQALIELMSKGYTVKGAHRAFPDIIPTSESIQQKVIADDKWREGLDKGYTLWYFAKLEDLNDLGTVLASERYPNVPFKEAEATLRREVDVLKFSIGKMAPVLSKRFDKTTKVEVNDVSDKPRIAIMNYYSDSATQLPSVLDVTPASTLIPKPE